MKLINKIKDLINDDKNQRVWERFWIILYLLSFEFVVAVVAGAVGAVAGVVAVVAVVVAVVAGAVAGVGAIVAGVGAVVVVVVVAVGVGANEPHLLIYFIIVEIIITIIAELSISGKSKIKQTGLKEVFE